jgi:putative ABC transport system permease protein
MTDRDRDYHFVAPKPSAEVDDELRFHLEQRIQDNIARGMAPDAARRAALARFGNVDDVRQECAELLAAERKAASRRDWLDDLRQDVRFAVRSAVRAPFFSAAAVITLALGIGANAAVFGVVKSVLLNALPYANADRLMRLYTPFRDGTQPRGSLSAGTISDVRERQRSFATFGAFLNPRDGIYTTDESPQVVKVMWAEPALFRTLGVSPIRGPGFQDDDALHDTTVVTVIPYSTWQGLFAGDPKIIGRIVRLNGLPRTVVGVLPPNFVPPSEEQTDFYLPLSMAPFMRDPIGVRGSHNFGFVGRLKAGVEPAAAQRELASIGAALEKEFAKDNIGFGLTGTMLRDAMVGDTRTPLLVLLASAGLVLLITCANLAGALLSRTISRRKEFAVRVALGAGRSRLMRQLLTESVMLALAGGVAGLLLAMTGLLLLRGLALATLPPYADLSLDTTAVLVTFALALVTGLAFGVGPALSAGRADPQGTLREQTRGSSESPRTRRMRGMLVAGQIALCVSLLTAAGLLARSLWVMTTSPAGFDANGLLTFTVQLPNARYGTAASRVLVHDQIEERLRALPGVSGVAIAMQLPTTVANNNGLFIEGAPWGPNEPVPFVLTSRVSDDYFRTMGIPLQHGRVFGTSDRTDAPPVLVINEAMAQRFWPKGNAIGAHVHVGPPNPSAPWITVVGIVGNTRNDPTHAQPEPMMFFGLRQQPFGDTYAVRTRGNPIALIAPVRATLRSIDATLPMYKVATMRDVIDKGFAARRLPVVLMTAFGALALLLASVGVYAMFASMTAAREREFGVRVALGSSRGAIARLVLRQGAVWMGVGLAVGTVGVVEAARLLRTQLFGVPQFDPIAIGLAVLTLLVCAGIALLVPLRRASRVDPITVLR